MRTNGFKNVPRGVPASVVFAAQASAQRRRVQARTAGSREYPASSAVPPTRMT